MAPPSARSFTSEYIWPSPDFAALRALVTNSCSEFLPPSRVTVTSTIEGSPRRETTYDSLEDFFQSGSDVTRWWAQLTGDVPSRSIWLNWNSSDGSLAVTVRTGDLADGEARAAEIRQLFEAQLGLRTRNRSSLELAYRSATPQCDFLQPFIAIAEETTGPQGQFRGTWKQADGIAGESRKWPEWQSQINAAQRWFAEWQGLGHRINANYDTQFSNVRIEIQTWDAALLTQLTQRIKALPGLRSSTDKPQKTGETRRYFLSAEADWDWYKQALAIILPFSQDDLSSPWGRVRRGGKNKSNRGYGDLDAWKQAVQAGITDGDIEQSYISWFGGERSLTFDLDHVRDLVSIDIQSVRPSEVEEMHLKLTTTLNLRKAPDGAYRDRQWGRTYDINLPDRAAFAAQLQLAIKNAFKGRRVLLNSGTLHLGGNDEEVKPYTDLPEMLADLQTVRDLTEFHIVLIGPGGDFIGIHAEKKLTRMRLLAAMRLDRFQAFAATLKTGLKKMEISQVYDADPATGTVQEKKNSGVLPWLTLLFGIIGTLGGTKIYEASREPAELIVDTPAVTNGLAHSQSPDTTISWTLKKPKAFGAPSLDHHHDAIVNVIRERDDKAIVKDQKESGSIDLKGLDDGGYDVKIDAGDNYKTLVLVVKTKP